MRMGLVVLALAAALSACAPTRSSLGPGPGGRGLSFRRQLTDQSALALSAGAGQRGASPDVRVMVRVLYSF